jgi:hypothetical protein
MSAFCQKRTYAAQQKAAYSITSSARSRNDSDMVKPRTFAVLRLTASSNLVGYSTGIFAGFTPCSSSTNCREMISP